MMAIWLSTPAPSFERGEHLFMTNKAMPGATFETVSVKGLGDLLIALTCLARVQPTARAHMRVLLGEHLLPLWGVLAPPFAMTPLPHPDRGAAALFQVKARSLADVARSACGLRRSIARAHAGGTLLFDEWDVRHRFLSLGIGYARALPRENNLYRSWNRFLAEQGWAIAEPQVTPVNGRLLHIFPGAREPERRFAPTLLHDLVARANRAGLEPHIFTVADEMPHLAAQGLPLTQMPRDFAATVEAVSMADRIISADSMTAHLSEYQQKPVFVLAPVAKYYWLPLSAALAGRHALFAGQSDDTALSAFLERDG